MTVVYVKLTKIKKQNLNQPTNPDTAVPENASDLEAKVAARAAAIEAKVADKIPAPPKETKLPKDFVLDCLNRNKVGDAALFCALFRGKYVFVQEWRNFYIGLAIFGRWICVANGPLPIPSVFVKPI